jgi:hypothetical protein
LRSSEHFHLLVLGISSRVMYDDLQKAVIEDSAVLQVVIARRPRLPYHLFHDYNRCPLHFVSWCHRFSPYFPCSGSPPSAGPIRAEGFQKLVKYGGAHH